MSSGIPSISLVNSTPAPLAAADVSTTGPTKLQAFFAKSAQKMRSTLPEPFASLPDPFLVFLHFEMTRMALNSETREVKNGEGKVIAGYGHFYHYQDSEAPQQLLKPITLKGVWIPKEALSLYTAEEVPASCPLLRSMGGKQEFLFMIHPESERFYSDLLSKYSKEVIEIPALPLSSLRTCVVAIPGEKGPTIAMVKVSLDKKVGDVKRLLGLKECANSVINASLLRNKCPDIPVMSDLFSFIPEGYEHGMIFRQIPPVLYEKMVVPLYSLFGLENGDFFKALLSSYPGTPTECITEKLLKPIAKLMVDSLFDQHISLQVHGQNLLLSIDPATGDISLLYRDMGGVNARLSMEERKKFLPEVLCDEKFFYTENHVKDAADVLETLTFKVLFNLEKQFVKQNMEESDKMFGAWRELMERNGFISNWTIPGTKSNDHEREQKESTFYRYGYFSKLFGSLYLKTLSNQNHLYNLSYTHPTRTYDYFIKQLGTNKTLNPHVKDWWFYDLIERAYAPQLPPLDK